jgi:hypothetical protein
MNVDELSERAVAVDQIERADVARLLGRGERRLIFALAERREQPTKVLKVREGPEVLPDKLRKGHRLREDRQVALQELDGAVVALRVREPRVELPVLVFLALVLVVFVALGLGIGASFLAWSGLIR